MANDVENPFICLFATCMFSSVKCLFFPLLHFLIGLFAFLQFGLKDPEFL